MTILIVKQSILFLKYKNQQATQSINFRLQRPHLYQNASTLK